MENLFLLLFFASLICLIVGLIKPTAFSRFIKGEITRKKISLIFGIAAFVFIMLFGAIADSDKKSNSQTPSAIQAETNQLSPEEQAIKAEEEAAAKKKAEEEKTRKEAEEKTKAEAAKELDADVRLSNVAFMIKNKEAQNWTDCKFVLNGKLFGSDFTYKTTVGINANDSIIIPMNEFTKGDGTMFDPYSTKAKNLFLSCEVENIHRSGYYIISE